MFWQWRCPLSQPWRPPCSKSPAPCSRWAATTSFLSAFGRIHPRWKTPHLASIVVGGFSVLLFVLSDFVGSITTVLTDAIQAIGLQVVFYYALAAIAVIVFYRRIAFRSVANFIFIFLWPAVAAVFLLVVGVMEVPRAQHRHQQRRPRADCRRHFADALGAVQTPPGVLPGACQAFDPTLSVSRR